MPQLKKLITNFSEFREILTLPAAASSVHESMYSNLTKRSYVPQYNPYLFKRMGGIDGFTKIF